MSQYRVRLFEDELDGGWVAECLDLPGAMGQGDTEETAMENVREAIGWVLLTRRVAALNG